uniref:CWF19-like protein 2 n=1 Tax=Peronospora matthiolae TaxID=2874970 RepID=A0AAV1V3L7_9STRA
MVEIASTDNRRQYDRSKKSLSSMSSLLHRLTFVRRPDDDEEKNRSPERQKKKKEKKEKRRKRERSHNQEHKSRHEGGHSREKEEEENKQTKKKTSLLRDEWMSMPFMNFEAEFSTVCKSPKEIETDRKQQKIRAEIDAGMREPVTGMVYGLHDPKNPDADPTVSSQMVEEEAGKAEKAEAEMPVFGDGGASWRAKMLKRAADRARSSGIALEKVVSERFGSVSALKSSARGSARDHAHLQYKQHRIDDGKIVHMASERRRMLGTRHDAKDKTLLSNYSKRVQRSLLKHDVEVDRSSYQLQTNKRSLQRRGDLKDEDEEPIDYDKLPSLEDCCSRAVASQRVGHRECSQEDDTTCSRKSNHRQKRPTRSRSRARARMDDSKRQRRSESRSRSRSRPCRPHSSSIDRGVNSPNLSKAIRDQQKTTSSETERPIVPTPAASEFEISRSRCAKAESYAEGLDLEKRNAFLYGSKESTVSSVVGKSDSSTSQFATELRGSFASRVDRTPDSSTRRSTSDFRAKQSPDKEDGKAVLNKLAAKALRAQMMGKTALFQKLTGQLNELEAQLEREKTTAAVPHFEAINGALPPLEKEDMRCGLRKGKKKLTGSTDTAEMGVAASLEALVREERMSRAHLGKGNMDSIYAQNIVRLGSRYKGTEVNAQNLPSGFDEEEQVDMKMLRQPGSNLTRRAQAQREHGIALNETKGWDERTRKCQLCMKSQAFKKHLMLSLGEFTYLAVPNRPRLHPGHCVIGLIDHTCSVVQADEQVIEEIARFQSALTRMCEEQYGKSMVFIEQTSAPYRKRHTLIECVPVDPELALDIPLYFKQELMQADGEWSTHKPVIDTSKGGVRKHVPPMFPYFHIAWCTQERKSGYAHVIEDENKFPRDFGVDVVAGMLGVTPPSYGRRVGGNRRSLDDDKRDVIAFLKEWKPHDWTRELDDGDIESGRK